MPGRQSGRLTGLLPRQAGRQAFRQACQAWASHGGHLTGRWKKEGQAVAGGAGGALSLGGQVAAGAAGGGGRQAGRRPGSSVTFGALLEERQAFRRRKTGRHCREGQASRPRPGDHFSLPISLSHSSLLPLIGGCGDSLSSLLILTAHRQDDFVGQWPLK